MKGWNSVTTAHMLQQNLRRCWVAKITRASETTGKLKKKEKKKIASKLQFSPDQQHYLWTQTDISIPFELCFQPEPSPVPASSFGAGIILI